MAKHASSDFLPAREISAFWRSDGEYSPSRVTELSRTGAFISTSSPAEVGKILSLRLALPDREICAQAVVRRVLSGQGMGVEFESIAGDDRNHLDLLVRQMELELPSEAVASSAPPGGISGGLGSTAPGDPDAPALARSRSLERRSRGRHKFVATAELTRLGFSESVRVHLADLAKGGCYVTVADPFPVGTALEISITANGQSFHAPATVASAHSGKGMGLAFAVITPKERLVLEGWLATTMERKWLASNRRRSQRILVNIPVQVAGKNTFGTDISEDTETISVSAHGALLKLEMDVTKGQTIVLRNVSTQNALECSVDYLGATRDGRREVGVSFVLPGRTLWQIAFPPSDWSPHHPCAKRA